MKDIFDIKNIDDLSDEVKHFFKRNKRCRRNSRSYRFLCLLNKANRPLTTKELLAGYYRCFREDLKMVSPKTTYGSFCQFKKRYYEAGLLNISKNKEYSITDSGRKLVKETGEAK